MVGRIDRKIHSFPDELSPLIVERVQFHLSGRDIETAALVNGEIDQNDLIRLHTMSLILSRETWSISSCISSMCASPRFYVGDGAEEFDDLAGSHLTDASPLFVACATQAGLRTFRKLNQRLRRLCLSVPGALLASC